MEKAAIVVCTWLHLIVLVVWIGHVFNALLLFSPLAKRYVKEADYGDFIAEYRSRDRFVAIGCIVVFFITGFFLMLFNEQYLGLGNFFANNWSIVLLVKHILVLAMVGLGVYQGTRVMPSLAQAGRSLTVQNEDKPTAVASVAKLEKARQTVTLSLFGLSLAVLLLTAVGEVL